MATVPDNTNPKMLVSITSVDLVSLTAVGFSKMAGSVIVYFNLLPSGVYVIPAVGEQWIVEKSGSSWFLDGKTDFQDPRTSLIPEVGMTALGGRGPTYVVGSRVEIRGDFIINGASYTPGGGGTTPTVNPASLAWDTETILNSGALASGYNDLGGGAQVNAPNGIMLESISFRLGGDPSATVGGSGGITLAFYRGTPTVAESALLLTITGVSAHDQIANVSPNILIPHNSILRTKVTLGSATVSVPVHIQWRGRRV